MREVLEYTDDFEKYWMEYVDNSSHSTIAHHIGWKEVIQNSLGHRPRYILAIEGSRIRGILPLFVVKTWWQSRYIISLPWIDYGGICAETERAEFVDLRSVKANKVNLTYRRVKVTFLLGFDKDSQKIWKGFDAKLRNQIRKAQRSGLTTEFGQIENLCSFYRVILREIWDLGTPVRSFDFFESILKIFSDTA